MSYGIKIINSYDEVQIDSKYRNIFVYQETSQNISFDKSYGGCCTDDEPKNDYESWNCNDYYIYRGQLNFSNTDEKPLFAFKPQSKPILFWGYYSSSGTYEKADFLWRDTSSSNLSIDFVVFTVRKNPTISSHGLIIYNSSGNLVFSSDLKPLKLINSYSVSTDGSSFQVQSTNNYFCAFPYSIFEAWDIKADDDDDQVFENKAFLQKIDSTTLKLKKITQYMGHGSVATTSFWPSSVQVLEIST